MNGRKNIHTLLHLGTADVFHCNYLGICTTTLPRIGILLRLIDEDHKFDCCPFWHAWDLFFQNKPWHSLPTTVFLAYINVKIQIRMRKEIDNFSIWPYTRFYYRRWKYVKLSLSYEFPMWYKLLFFFKLLSLICFAKIHLARSLKSQHWSIR